MPARRRLIWLLLAATSCTGEPPHEESPPRLELTFLADFNIPPGSLFPSKDGEEFGGISAVWYSESRDSWMAASDARVNAHLYELDVSYDGERLSVEPKRLIYLTDENGSRFPGNALDPEGLVETPWETYVVSSEADSRREPVHQSKLLEFDLEGRRIRSIAFPERFLVKGWPPETGVRDNRAFESLGLSPDGKRLFVGVEDTLLQDGASVGFETPGFCRILVMDVRGRNFTPAAEHVYPIGPVAPALELEEPREMAGLVELAALSHTRLLALERVFIEGATQAVMRVRIYAVDIRVATDVSGIESLAGGDWQPVRKELVLDFDDVVPALSPDYPFLDNFEAMALGPELPEGGREFLVISDDNFRPHQRTAFFLFRLTGL